MASANSVPENEGKNIKNECEDPEVNAMDLKMKENYQKNTTAGAKQQAASPGNVYINRAGRAPNNAPITTNNTQHNNQRKLSKDCEDVESLKGKFSWKLIAGYHVPYIIRVINGEFLKFVSVRMAETQLLSNYLHYLHDDIYKCTSVKSHKITDFEAKLLNEINQKHADCLYGKKMFFAGKDYIVRLEEVHEFYTFIEVCYKKLMCNITPGSTEKCGFIRINSKSVVPYCIEDNRKHVPLLYFESKTEILKCRAQKLENWNLAFLKFCCRILGITNELFSSDFCTVINLDDIKNYFPPETNFEEYWPGKEVCTHLLTNQKSTCVNPHIDWIREPLKVVSTENNTLYTLTAPAPVLPPIIPEMIFNQNRWPPNQMSSTMSQGSSLISDAGHFLPPPLLFHTDSAASIIGNIVSHSNVVPISQCVTTMYNPMTNSNVISHSSQMRQLYTQLQQPYSGQSVYDRLTNNQQRNSPSSPVPQTVHVTPVVPNIRWELTRIPERMWAHSTSNDDAYKIQRATLQRKMIICINARPYIYSELMVTLYDLVKMVLPEYTVAKCAYVLSKCLKTTIFSGNSEQLAVLWRNRRLTSMHPNDTPMVMLQDVTRVFPQLINTLVVIGCEENQIQQYQSAGGPSKRQRTAD